VSPAFDHPKIPYRETFVAEKLRAGSLRHQLRRETLIGFCQITPGLHRLDYMSVSVDGTHWSPPNCPACLQVAEKINQFFNTSVWPHQLSVLRLSVLRRTSVILVPSEELNASDTHASVATLTARILALPFFGLEDSSGLDRNGGDDPDNEKAQYFQLAKIKFPQNLWISLLITASGYRPDQPKLRLPADRPKNRQRKIRILAAF
jgi:hypothetical protein